MKNTVSYPACFQGMDLDAVNYHLAQGFATKQDAENLVKWWNESGKRVTVATLGERSVTLGRCKCLAPYISIRD